MTVLTYIERTVSDQEPNAHNDVTVKRADDGIGIVLKQGGDLLMMSLEQAGAVAAAIIALGNEMDPKQ